MRPTVLSIVFVVCTVMSTRSSLACGKTMLGFSKVLLECYFTTKLICCFFQERYILLSNVNVLNFSLISCKLCVTTSYVRICSKWRIFHIRISSQWLPKSGQTFTLMVFINPLALPFEVSHPTATLSCRLCNEPKLDTTMLWQHKMSFFQNALRTYFFSCL
jgi:hypothetical protein